MLAEVENNVGERPKKASADAGYFSETNVTDKKLQNIDLYVAPERHRHGEMIEDISPAAPSPEATVIERMR